MTARIAELEEFAKKYMAENYTPQYGSSQEMDVDIDITGAAIDLTASHTFPTTIMSLTGIDELNLTSHSQIMKAMRPIEMVLVMDTTGSMATDNKIGGAKTAARESVEYGLWRISRVGSGKRILARGARALCGRRQAQQECL